MDRFHLESGSPAGWLSGLAPGTERFAGGRWHAIRCQRKQTGLRCNTSEEPWGASLRGFLFGTLPDDSSLAVI